MPRILKVTVAAIALALAAAAPAAQAAPGTQRFASPRAALVTAPQAISPSQALRRARRAWHTTGTGRGAADLTPLLRQLATQLPQLHGSERRQAQSLLARPTDGASDPQENGYAVPEAPGSPACGAHYCVHWVAVGDDAPDLADSDTDGIPDYVETASAVAERAHQVENDELGWRLAKTDGTLGGDLGKTDIYLKELGGQGLYGYAAIDPGQQISRNDRSVYSYLVLDDDYRRQDFPQYESPITPLEVTIAHEYNHILHFTYDAQQDTWMFESTATWMEGRVYPLALDYLQYLPGWTQLASVPLTTFNGTDPNDRGNVKVYGSSVWNKWLDARYGPDVVRDAWEGSLLTEPPSFAVAAFDRSIRAHAGRGFADEFSRFAAATAEWQAQNSGFPDGRLYPDVVRAGKRSVNGPPGRVALNHTTSAFVDVRPTNAARIRLGVSAPAGTAAALALVGRTGGPQGGQMTVTLRDLPKGGSGTVTLQDPSRFSRITAVLVNADAKIKGSSRLTGDFIFARDKQPFYARVSSDLTAPRVSLRRSTPRPRATGVSPRSRVKVVFTEPVLGVTAKSLQLVASNGRVVKARVKFATRGSRVATLTPSRALGRGRGYRVRVTPAVTDTTLNPLSRTTSWSFRTAG
jgi:hypothetical protein